MVILDLRPVTAYTDFFVLVRTERAADQGDTTRCASG
jgi:hypothetical protein